MNYYDRLKGNKINLRGVVYREGDDHQTVGIPAPDPKETKRK